MGKIIFFTGGARSGKSQFAEDYIRENNYKKKIYFATAIPFDDEMKDRIKKHIKRRDESWSTVEGYRDITKKLEENFSKNFDVILFDCITNFVSNFMIMDREIDWDNVSQETINIIENEIIEEIKSFLIWIKNQKIDCIFVTNEIGMGLVPSYPLGRYFRDICGRVNQIVAKESEEAYLAVSGIKVKIK